MADVVLYHHIQGLTDGIHAFADELRRDGHVVHTPDLFEGRTFESIEEGLAFAETTGFDVLHRRGLDAVEGLGTALVYAGVSFGVMVAQRLAQTRPGGNGALLMCACLPVTEFSESWPATVPVQIHGKEGDSFFAEDLPAARELDASTESARLFLYPGREHLFMDASLDAYDPEASALLTARAKNFLKGR